MTTKTLILFAHPNQAKSDANIPLYHAAHQLSQQYPISCVDLYAEYPRHNIDVKKEQSRLIEHDVIIFQFPLYWYSTPSILKDWQDLVLEYGFAYGHNGNALQGKKFICAFTAGANANAYQTEGLNQYPINELLRPLQQMAHLTGMCYLPPFVLFGAREAQSNGALDQHLKQWQSLLIALSNNKLSCKDLAEYSDSDMLINSII